MAQLVEGLLVGGVSVVSLSKIFYPVLINGSPRKTVNYPDMTEKLLTAQWDKNHQNKHLIV